MITIYLINNVLNLHLCYVKQSLPHSILLGFFFGAGVSTL